MTKQDGVPKTGSLFRWGVRIGLGILAFVILAILVTLPTQDPRGPDRTSRDEQVEALEGARSTLALLPQFNDRQGEQYCVYQTLRLDYAIQPSSPGQKSMEIRYASLPQSWIRLPAPVSPLGGMVIMATTSDRAGNQAKGSLFLASIHTQFRELLASRFEHLTATNRASGATVSFDIKGGIFDFQQQSASTAYYAFFDESIAVYGERGGVKELVFDRSTIATPK